MVFKISLTKSNSKGNISRDVSFVADGSMLTKHGNPSDTFRIYREKKAKGEKVTWKRGVLFESFKGQTAQEIKAHVINELEELKEKMKKEMEIKWTIGSV